MKKGKLCLTGLMILMVSSLNANTNTNAKSYQNGSPPAMDVSTCRKPCESDGWDGFELGADFLWWKLVSDNTSYGKRSPQVQVFVEPDRLYGTTTIFIDYVDTHWEPGVRVRAAKENLWRDLDLCANYVFIEGTSSASSSASISSSPLAFSVLQTTTLPQNAQFGTTHPFYTYLFDKYKYTYQSFDVLFSTTGLFKKYYKLKPFMGVTGIYFTQKFDYSGLGNINGTQTSGNWEFKSHFSAYGFKVGTDFDWRFWNGLSLHGSGAGMITMGSYHNIYIIDTNFPDPTFTYPNYKAHAKDYFHNCLTGWQMAMGFLYEKCFSHWKLDLKLDYEMIVWNNLPAERQIIDFGNSSVNLTAPGGIAIGFQGISGGVNFHF